MIDLIQNERQLQTERIFANHTFNKRLVARIYKELSKPNKKIPVKKSAKDLNRNFTKEGIYDGR